MTVDNLEFGEHPFSETKRPRLPYLSASHRKALAALHYGLERGLQFQVVVGVSGIGKTMVMRDLEARAGGQRATEFVTAEQFMAALCRLPGDHAGVQVNSLAVATRETPNGNPAQMGCGRRALLLIDDADQLDHAALETILSTLTLWSRPQSPAAGLPQLVLAGTPALAEKWSASGTTHIPHCICLEPLSSVEVSEYIKHRLRLADVSEGTTLTDATCALIAERSQGIPANINRLCLHALNGRGASVDEQLAIDNTTAKPESDDARDDHTMPSQPRALPERHAATVVVWPILLMGVVLLGVSLWYARLEPAFSKVAAKALARSHLKAVAEKVDNPAPPARISTGPPPPAVAAESPRPDVVAAPSSPISRETRAASPLQGAAMRRSIPPTVQRADKVAAHDQQRSHPSATTVADTELVALAIRLGEADMRLGKYDRAIGILRQALARVPGDAQLLGQIRRARRAKAAEAATLSE